MLFLLGYKTCWKNSPADGADFRRGLLIEALD
ncbi:MAG: hypothetical protein RLZZ28_8 [Bacteroidota bacterium]